MTTYISLLRGINVSGQKSIKMADLKALYEQLNFTNVTTYIQSGNVLFTTSETNVKQLEQTIAQAITAHYGFTVPVMVITKAMLYNIITTTPFTTKPIECLHITLLAKAPIPALIAAIPSTAYGVDECIVQHNCVYLYCPNGYGRTKLSNTFFEAKFKTQATTRNWKTITTLYTMLQAK
jgi:uncharacterized protein (DUF1697 family)